ncbi:conserved Plasmodium protein, unknown function [Plasmodium berghei]|uniref:Uncharacterized protein n=2 Tax=Plasmodium berghei TaxID=5821 RepID=A0A509AIW9_PLABA|nr:conserved Plasmodium protein, unknown function [Plasmodium berghei ANKA]CXI31590.1 conserved Plasmodium protein, unknown function [Plasmodium berghei]SCM21010.1 conserved Plasmodium protein, unknown function [Plasmodium berghei]SCN24409.1 conserved Plasmodium protein, unknown function [Plasmodium berghei]SCO59604.1 conserved Plasmodium protein, unknown function [Plasmodium berghei]SCO60797.1 conserved Plasmodium protein, unknown function [Plasmodium berghei]|eukprot:XP_034421100.1 conserved Plasmodium protein, unknown function [Plasmodium berghei ANKA]
MEKVKTGIPLIVGSYGLTLSFYLMYENRTKKKWAKINGCIDNVTLKYSKHFQGGSFHLNIKYFFFINNERIENDKEYKIYMNLFKTPKDQNIETNIYTKNIFDQVSREKDIYILYNPQNYNQSEPLIYIYNNEILEEYKLINKLKKKIHKIQNILYSYIDIRKITANLSLFNKIETNKNKCVEDVHTEKGSMGNHSDTGNNNNNKLLKDNKKLINAYDINSLFPIYMFSCSMFLCLSFFLKKRIHTVRNELLQKKKFK